MTVAQRTPPRPLLPVLSRIALGLGVAVAGLGLAATHLRVVPTPGLKAVQTPVDLPLGGAAALNVRLTSNRADLTVGGVPWPGRAALTAHARHRERNPLRVETAREGRTLSADLGLPVRALDEGLIPLNSLPLQHKLDALLARSVPVTLTTETYSGDTALDLHALRVRSLGTRTSLGDVRATLPERQSGPLTFVTLGGDVTLRASSMWRAPSLRVNTEGGDVSLDLGEARTEALNIGTRSGDVTGTLPRADHSSVATASGDLDLTVPEGAAGTLDLRAEGGSVTLSLPPGVDIRVRFTDRAELDLPRGLRRQGNTVATSGRALTDPDLDLFLDAPSAALTLRGPPSENPAPAPRPPQPPMPEGASRP